jgi:hypothetical protein
MEHDRLALSRKWNIKWKKSDRFERRARFTLNGSAAEIFPLLCPVLEYAWLPGWQCVMVYSESGVAENNCLFYTKENFGKKALWTCIAQEPDTFVDYLVTSGRDMVMRLSVRLEENGNKTEVDWRMLFTGLSGLGRHVIKRRFSRENFEKMMQDRERELNWYLKHGTMVKTGEGDHHRHIHE